MTVKEDLDALGEVDRQNRVARTTVQVGVPGALVIVGTWVASLAHLDLDPGAGRDIPANVTAALIVLITAVLAAGMNRKP